MRKDSTSKKVTGAKASKVSLNQARGIETIVGGRLLIIGDTHFSEIYQGSHKSYIKECIWLMTDILKKIDESGATGLILLGDVFGVREQRLKTLLFRSNMLNFFKMVRSKLRSNNRKAGLGVDNVLLASVKGNHDMSGVDNITEFEFFIEQGMFTNPLYVDVLNDEGLKTRLHFMNYGDEHEELELAEGKGVSNVVLAHGEFLIPEKTDWIHKSRAGVNLADMSNLHGVSLVISGHIHTPSQHFDGTVMSNGEVIKLFYPGSPARVAERVADVFLVELSVGDGGEIDVEVREFGLPGVDEVFIPIEEDAGMYSEELELVPESEEFLKRSERLKEILEDIISSRLSQGDLIKQIDRVPSVSDEARERAKAYLSLAE